MRNAQRNLTKILMGDDFGTQEDSLPPPITTETPTKSMFEFDSLIDNVFIGNDPYTNGTNTLQTTTTNSKESASNNTLRLMTPNNGHHNVSNEKTSDALNTNVLKLPEFSAFDTNCFGMRSQSQTKPMQNQSTNGQT